MSKKARSVSAYLVKERDEPDFQLRIANALVKYGNDQLEEAAKLHLMEALRVMDKAKYDRNGPANSFAVVEDVNRNWAAAIRGLAEQYIHDLSEPKRMRDRLKRVRRTIK